MSLILALLLQVSIQDEAPMDPAKYRGKIELWRDYSHPEVISHEQLAGVTLSLAVPLSLAADEVILGDGKEQSVWERLIRGLAAGQILQWIESPLTSAAHEYGHFRVYQIAGMSEIGFVEDDKTNFVRATPIRAFELMFRQMTLKSDSYLATVAEREVVGFQNRLTSFSEGTKFIAMMDAGGLNQEQFLAEKIGERVQQGEAVLTDVVMYYLSLTATWLYPSDKDGDPDDYVEGLRRLGVETSLGEVRQHSQWPKIFSGSSIAFLIAIGEYFANGDKEVSHLSLPLGERGRIYAPEFASYLTLRGPTLNVRERITCEGNSLDLLYERSYADGSTEWGIGWQGKLFSFLSARFKHLRNDGHWTEGGPVVHLSDWFSVGAVAYQARGYTFHRDVFGAVPDFVEDKESGVKLFVELNVRF